MEATVIHPQTYTLLKGKQSPIYYRTEEKRIEKAKEIIEAIERYFKVDHEKLMSKWRYRDIVIPRQIAMYMIKVKTKLGDGAIAKLFNRDRTTVIYGVQSIDGFLRLGHPIEVVEQVDEIKKLLSNI